MKTSVSILLVFLVGVALSFNDVDNDVCSYISVNGDSYSFYGRWMNATDSFGRNWFINVCPSSNAETSPCPSDSSVCFISDGVTKSAGQTSTTLWSDSPFGSDQGAELILGSSTKCEEPNDEIGVMKTSIEMVCGSSDEPIITVDASACVTTITVNVSSACPSPVIQDGWDFLQTSDVEVVSYHIGLSSLFLFTMACLSACMCCCCMVRRRKCQMKKAQAMRQFSNVAFQPIPQNQQQIKSISIPIHTTQQQQQSIPAYNPYVVQQPNQFMYYYYPSQQAPIQQVDRQQQQQQQQEGDDAKLARELQAQFDREL